MITLINVGQPRVDRYGTTKILIKKDITIRPNWATRKIFFSNELLHYVKVCSTTGSSIFSCSCLGNLKIPLKPKNFKEILSFERNLEKTS